MDIMFVLFCCAHFIYIIYEWFYDGYAMGTFWTCAKTMFDSSLCKCQAPMLSLCILKMISVAWRSRRLHSTHTVMLATVTTLWGLLERCECSVRMLWKSCIWRRCLKKIKKIVQVIMKCSIIFYYNKCKRHLHSTYNKLTTLKDHGMSLI